MSARGNRWTEAMAERLLALKASGATDAEAAELINNRFGTALTTQAVSTRLKRLRSGESAPARRLLHEGFADPGPALLGQPLWPRDEVVAMDNRALARMAFVYPALCPADLKADILRGLGRAP